MTAAIVILANAPLPVNAIPVTAAGLSTPEAHGTFIGSAVNPLATPLEMHPEDLQPYAAAGQMLGYAMRLQAIRNGAPLSVFSPDMGWEFKEDLQTANGSLIRPT